MRRVQVADEICSKYTVKLTNIKWQTACITSLETYLASILSKNIQITTHFALQHMNKILIVKLIKINNLA